MSVSGKMIFNSWPVVLHVFMPKLPLRLPLPFALLLPPLPLFLHHSKSLFSHVKFTSVLAKNQFGHNFSSSIAVVKYHKLVSKNMSTQYEIVEKGTPDSTNYSVFFKNETGNAISPLHDIPLFADEANNIYNMVVEVPRWTNAKMEISLKTELNPIKQDVKKGKLRFVANCFPHHGYIWNYGALPQTWECPDHIEPLTSCKGDNDPIDVLEIGYRVAKRGEVVQVKVLGTIALIDEGETDWKVITIDVNDPLADQMNDIGDVEKLLPGLMRATIEWFKIYKIPDGKPENQFAFNGEAKNAAFAKNVIAETHKFWQGLIKNEINSDIISRVNTTIAESPFLTTQEEGDQLLDQYPDGGDAEEISDTIDKWHFLHLK